MKVDASSSTPNPADWDWYELSDPYRQELAWRAAKADPELFLAKAWKIKVPDGRPRTLQSWEAQAAILRKMADVGKLLSLKARQIGWTTVTAGFVGHDIIFNEWHPWLFVSRTQLAAIKNLGMVTFGILNLPSWMKERIKIDKMRVTGQILELDNGSWVESIAATAGTGRGEAVYGVVWDEAAYAAEADNIYAALEPLCYGKFFVLSTANGMGNWFHAKWLDSQEGFGGFEGVFYPWDARAGRDGKWYKSKQREYRGQMWAFYQEYPSNPGEAFARSGRTAIDYDLLEEFEWATDWTRYEWVGDRFDLEHPIDKYDDEPPLVIDVFEHPTVARHPEHGYALYPPNYVLFVDPAEGLEHGDYTGIVVYDVQTGRCVARIRTHYMVEGIPEVIAWVGHWYHRALVAVERQNHGFFVNHTLANELNYSRLYRMDEMSKIRKGIRTTTFGWSTNASTKPKMVKDFLRLLRDHQIDPVDPVLRIEAQTFIIDESGKYGASPGNHDDVIIAHMGAGQLLLEAHKYPVFWRDVEKGFTTMAELDELADMEQFRQVGLKIGSGPRIQSGRRPSFTVTPT